MVILRQSDTFLYIRVKILAAMFTPESGPVPMTKISVGSYFDEADHDLEQQIAEIHNFLLTHGGSCEIFRTTVSRKPGLVLVTFLATIPRWFTNLHHGFDSKLNSTTSGFGVAWVEDAN